MMIAFIYITILCFQADSPHSLVILHELLAFYSVFLLEYPLKWCTYSNGMDGATWISCHLGASSVYTIQLCTMSLHAKPHMYGVCVFSCNLPPAFLAEWLVSFTCCCGKVTRGWNGYWNESAQKFDPGEENSPTAPAGIRTSDRSIMSPDEFKPCFQTIKSCLCNMFWLHISKHACIGSVKGMPAALVQKS